MSASRREDALPVDVILTTFAGRTGWLTEAVDSVVKQTYPHWHLTVVDDASPDDKSGFVRERYAGEERVTIVRLEENQGTYGAKREGIRRTSQDAIAFIDDDDRWHPEKLALQVERLTRAPAVQSVHTDVRYIDENGEVIPGVAERQNARRAAIDYDAMDARQQARALFRYYSIRSASSLVLRRAIEEAGGYENASLAGAAGSEFWIRFTASGHRVAHVARPLYDRRVHAGNVSRRDAVEYLPNRLRATDKLVASFPFLEDLADLRRIHWLKLALRTSLEGGEAANVRRLVKQLAGLQGFRIDLAGAWLLSWLGRLRQPIVRARGALRRGS